MRAAIRKRKEEARHLQVVVLDPHQRVVELGIHRLDIFGRQFLVQHALVEGQRERRVDEAAVVQRLRSSKIGFILVHSKLKVHKFNKISSSLNYGSDAATSTKKST